MLPRRKTILLDSVHSVKYFVKQSKYCTLYLVRAAAVFPGLFSPEGYLRVLLTVEACDRSALAARYPQRRGFRDQS